MLATIWNSELKLPFIFNIPKYPKCESLEIYDLWSSGRITPDHFKMQVFWRVNSSCLPPESKLLEISESEMWCGRILEVISAFVAYAIVLDVKCKVESWFFLKSDTSITTLN